MRPWVEGRARKSCSSARSGRHRRAGSTLTLLRVHAACLYATSLNQETGRRTRAFSAALVSCRHTQPAWPLAPSGWVIGGSHSRYVGPGTGHGGRRRSRTCSRPSTAAAGGFALRRLRRQALPRRLLKSQGQHGLVPLQPRTITTFWAIVKGKNCHSPCHRRGLSPGLESLSQSSGPRGASSPGPAGSRRSSAVVSLHVRGSGTGGPAVLSSVPQPPNPETEATPNAVKLTRKPRQPRGP